MDTCIYIGLRYPGLCGSGGFIVGKIRVLGLSSQGTERNHQERVSLTLWRLDATIPEIVAFNSKHLLRALLATWLQDTAKPISTNAVLHTLTDPKLATCELQLQKRYPVNQAHRVSAFQIHGFLDYMDEGPKVLVQPGSKTRVGA